MDPEDFDPKTFFKFHGTWDARAGSVMTATEILSSQKSYILITFFFLADMAVY